MSVPTGLNTGGTRNAILDGVLSFFQGMQQFTTVGRIVKQLESVPREDRPALLLLHDSDMHVPNKEGVPGLVTMEVQLFIYAYWPKQDNDVPPSQQMADLLDAVDLLISPPPLTGRQTINGLVSHCWIEGKVIVVPGDLTGDGLAVIPLKILIPS